MAQTIKNTAYGTPTSYLTTELNALAIDGVVLGAAINNGTNRHFWCKVEVDLSTKDLSAAVSPGVQIRLIESLDGTNYEDNDDKAYAITIPVADTSAAHLKVSGRIQIPPGNFKLAVVNKTEVIFGATDNILTYVTFTPESV